MKIFCSEISRRGLLAGAAAIALVPASARALTNDQARALIQQVVNEINSAINSGRGEASMYRDFERIFSRYADVPTIARSTLGPDARRASSAQLRAFSEAFQTYISRKYGRRFREFIGGQVIVQGARPVKSFYEVNAIADLRGEAPFGVTFLVSDRSGSNRFFDLVVEGISLLRSERVEIGAMLDRRGGDIDALIADLRRAG